MSDTIALSGVITPKRDPEKTIRCMVRSGFHTIETNGVRSEVEKGNIVDITEERMRRNPRTFVRITGAVEVESVFLEMSDEDISSSSADSLKQLIQEESDIDSLNRVFLIEEEGKNRPTVLATLETRLGELQGE